MLNGRLEGKWIESGMKILESVFGDFRDVRMVDHPLIRGLWRMVFFDDLGAVAMFFLELQAGAEMILQGAPKGAVHLVHQRHQDCFVKPVIAE